MRLIGGKRLAVALARLALCTCSDMEDWEKHCDQIIGQIPEHIQTMMVNMGPPSVVHSPVTRILPKIPGFCFGSFANLVRFFDYMARSRLDFSGVSLESALAWATQFELSDLSEEIIQRMLIVPLEVDPASEPEDSGPEAIEEEGEDLSIPDYLHGKDKSAI